MKKTTRERAVALILTLILVLVLSVMAVSLTFVSRTETWSSMNYRMMTQSRYAAESGINAAANYLMYTYAAPGAANDPLSGYDMTKSPVTVAGTTTPVVLAVSSSKSPNGNTYPSSAVGSGFQAAAGGSLTADNTSMTYAPYATLLSMQQFSSYPGSNPVTLQTWDITSDGSDKTGST